MTLGTVMHLDHIANINIRAIDKVIQSQKFDPIHWEVISFQDASSNRLKNSITEKEGSLVLKPLGSTTVASEAGDCREADIKFAYVGIELNFIKVVGKQSKVTTSTFIELPQSTVTVLNPNGAPVKVQS